MKTVHINLPVPLRKFAKGIAQISIQADTVLDAILQLNKLDPSMSERLLEADQSQPKKYINVYLDGKNIRQTGGLKTALNEQSRLEIMTAFAGG